MGRLFPRGMQVFYAYPAIRGCRHVDLSVGRRLFPNYTEVSVGASDAPIAGFLKVSRDGGGPGQADDGMRGTKSPERFSNGSLYLGRLRASRPA